MHLDDVVLLAYSSRFCLISSHCCLSRRREPGCAAGADQVVRTAQFEPAHHEVEFSGAHGAGNVVLGIERVYAPRSQTITAPAP